MDSPVLALTDFLLTTIHGFLIVFVLCGWAFRRSRRAHLVIVLMTAFSWVVLGAAYGWGYCFLTDWAWAIKRARGELNLPSSFIEYALERLTGSRWNSSLVFIATAAVGGLATVLSIVANVGKSRLLGALHSWRRMQKR